MSMTIQEAVKIVCEWTIGRDDEYDEAARFLKGKRLCDADEACRIIRALLHPYNLSTIEDEAHAFLRENGREP